MHGEGPEEQIQGNIMGEIMATYETDNNIPESLKKTRTGACGRKASERIQKRNETNWETNVRLETGDGRDKQKRDK